MNAGVFQVVRDCDIFLSSTTELTDKEKLHFLGSYDLPRFEVLLKLFI